MIGKIVITTGARLHFGLLSYEPTSRRHFGGVGLMIDSPRVRVVAQTADRDCVSGVENSVAAAREFLARYRSGCPKGKQPPACRLEVQEAIPAHVGLGSGTQLAMAVARALAILADDNNADPLLLAERVRRGVRSALGVHGFGRGGFLVDAGKADQKTIGSLVARLEFPGQWRMLIVTPTDCVGLSGSAESEAFARLPRMPETTTERLCRIVLMRLLPAVIEADCDNCGDALFEFGRTVGEYFAPVQGGTYAHRSMTHLVSHLRRQGLRGVGQTSWGPTVFVLAADPQTAEQLMGDLSADSRFSNCRFHLARPMNTGAVVEPVTDAEV